MNTPLIPSHDPQPPSSAPLTHSVAHYLMAMVELRDARGYIYAAEIARCLDIDRRTVAVGLKKLKAKGWVVEDERRFLRLAPIAEVLAQKLLRNRSVLTSFFSEILGLPQTSAQSEACKVEYLLEETTIERIATLLSNHHQGPSKPPTKPQTDKHSKDCSKI